MPCPFFEPTAPLPWTSWRGSLRPPLGAPYEGCCRAAAERFQPGVEALTENCNMGYAAGRCPRFREGSGDAVRFSLSAEPSPAAKLRWLVEAAGLPKLAGEVDLADVEAGVALDGVPATVAAQMRAYAASFRASRARR